MTFSLQEMSALSVSELQAEMSPRISGADVLELLDPNKFSRPKAQVLDVRSPDLYPFNTLRSTYPVVAKPGAAYNSPLSRSKRHQAW